MIMATKLFDSRMAWITAKWSMFFLLLVIVHSAQAQETYEPDAIPHTPNNKPSLNPNRWRNGWTNGWTNGWSNGGWMNGGAATGGDGGGSGGGAGARRRYDRFNNWMKVLQEFLSEGNWLQGGPENLMEFITKYFTKLMDIMLRREGGSGTILPAPHAPQPPPSSGGSSDSDNPIETEDSTRISSGGGAARNTDNILFGRQKINLNDLLKSIPINELNFNPE